MRLSVCNIAAAQRPEDDEAGQPEDDVINPALQHILIRRWLLGKRRNFYWFLFYTVWRKAVTSAFLLSSPWCRTL